MQYVNLPGKYACRKDIKKSTFRLPPDVDFNVIYITDNAAGAAKKHRPAFRNTRKGPGLCAEIYYENAENPKMATNESRRVRV